MGVRRGGVVKSRGRVPSEWYGCLLTLMQPEQKQLKGFFLVIFMKLWVWIKHCSRAFGWVTWVQELFCNCRPTLNLSHRVTKIYSVITVIVSYLNLWGFFLATALIYYIIYIYIYLYYIKIILFMWYFQRTTTHKHTIFIFSFIKKNYNHLDILINNFSSLFECSLLYFMCTPYYPHVISHRLIPKKHSNNSQSLACGHWKIVSLLLPCVCVWSWIDGCGFSSVFVVVPQMNRFCICTNPRTPTTATTVRSYGFPNWKFAQKNYLCVYGSQVEAVETIIPSSVLGSVLQWYIDHCPIQSSRCLSNTFCLFLILWHQHIKQIFLKEYQGDKWLIYLIELIRQGVI